MSRDLVSRTASLARAAVVAAAVVAGLPDVAAPDSAGRVVQLSAADRKDLDDLLGKGVVGEAVASKPVAAPDLHLPPKSADLTYRVLDEKGGTTEEKHRLSDADPSQSARGWQYAAGPDTIMVIEQGTDGSLAVVAEYDRKQDVISRFTPGEPLLINGLKPGESRHVSMKVDVVDIDDPTDVEHRGTLDVTYAHLGTFEVKVPAGSFTAPLLKWSYKGEIGPASVETTQYRFIAEGTGMVAMIERRNISALLIYRDKSRRGKLLMKTD